MGPVEVMRIAFEERKVPGPSFMPFVDPSTSRGGSTTTPSSSFLMVSDLTTVSFSGSPGLASFCSTVTVTAASAALEKTNPHGLLAASSTKFFALSRSTAQNSQPTLLGDSAATSHAFLHTPLEQRSALLGSQSFT